MAERNFQKKKRNDVKKHIEQLKRYYETIGIAWGDAECNPMTDVVEGLEELEVL